MMELEAIILYHIVSYQEEPVEGNLIKRISRARQTRVRAYARTRKCKNNGGSYGFVKLEVRGRTWYFTNPRTPFPPISLSCVHRIWRFKSYVIHLHQHHSLIVHIAITYAQS